MEHLDLLDLLKHGSAGVAVQDDPYVRALDLANRLVRAIESLGQGPTGLATRALFGTTAETRGRLLKDRRRIAADELGLMPSTFRKYYEEDLILDVAFALWSDSRRRAGWSSREENA